jgi:hypothetical protein
MAVKCAAQLAQGCAAQQQRTSCANDNKTSGIFSNTDKAHKGSFKLFKYRKIVVKTIFKHEKSAQGSKKKVLSSGIFLGVL